MKKIIALLLALTICFSLCACGASETQKAVEAYQEFVSNNPYPIETDLQNQFILEDLIYEYENQLNILKEKGISVEQCPEIAYAEKVLQLKEYIKYNEFIVCATKTQETIALGIAEIGEVISAGSAANATVAFSKFNSAAARFDEAHSIAEQYDQEAERIDELTECYKMLSNAATNIATGMYTNSSFIMQTGIESLQEQAIIYSILLSYVDTLCKEVDEILKTLA